MDFPGRRRLPILIESRDGEKTSEGRAGSSLTCPSGSPHDAAHTGVVQPQQEVEGWVDPGVVALVLRADVVRQHILLASEVAVIALRGERDPAHSEAGNGHRRHAQEKGAVALKILARVSAQHTDAQEQHQPHGHYLRAPGEVVVVVLIDGAQEGLGGTQAVHGAHEHIAHDVDDSDGPAHLHAHILAQDLVETARAHHLTVGDDGVQGQQGQHDGHCAQQHDDAGEQDAHVAHDPGQPDEEDGSDHVALQAGHQDPCGTQHMNTRRMRRQAHC